MSEYPNSNSVNNMQNTFNYLPGYAAFVSGFLAGFCGVRHRDFQLDLVYPSENFGQYQAQVSSAQFPVFKQPASNTENWNITGLLFRGNRLDIIYDLRAKSVEIRNRRANDQTGQVDDMLEVVIYEGTQITTKSLRTGDSVKISLSTELWYYAPKKSRIQRNHYSNNMHILATVYPIQYSNKIERANNSDKILRFNYILSCILILLNLNLLHKF